MSESGLFILRPWEDGGDSGKGEMEQLGLGERSTEVCPQESGLLNLGGGD